EGGTGRGGGGEGGCCGGQGVPGGPEEGRIDLRDRRRQGQHHVHGGRGRGYHQRPVDAWHLQGRLGRQPGCGFDARRSGRPGYAAHWR
ncbi:hypothetical protein HKBW3S47_01158, partial [Candidatus Hakubella thermalkaliphila]